MCVSECGWVCEYVDINKGGCEGAWVRVGLSMDITFHLVSKERLHKPFEFSFYM